MTWIYLQRKTHCYLTPYIEIIGKVYSHTARKVWFGKSFENYFVTYTNGVMTWYAKQEIVQDLYSFVSHKALENPPILRTSYEKFKHEIEKLIEISEEIHKTQHHKLSYRKLWEYYAKYIQIYETATLFGEPLPLVTKDQVVEEIKKKLAAISISKHNINQIIATLTQPLQKSFIWKEEEDLLKIACEIRDPEQLESTEILAKLKLHHQRYCWLPYDYGVQVWNIEHFKKTLQTLLKEKNCQEELQEKSAYFTQLEQEQKELIKKHSIPDEIVKLCEYVKLATYMMDYKKELFTKSHYLSIPLIKEIAKRSGTNEVLVRFMNHQEIQNALLENKPIPNQELQARYNLSICLWDQQGQTKFVPQEKVESFIKEHLQENPEEQRGKKLYGTCASIGKYKGKVRIIKSPSHINEVEQGDVLIAPMTSPDYVVGMKKAGAIVTDEGGLTCHAAIVSRELKIPCIVGTNKSTKFFKTGDLVEVNANHGSVRLLN